MPHLIFVYGTLKRGFAHHAHYLGKAAYESQAMTDDPYPLVLSGPDYIPVLVDIKGQGLAVKGELYCVNDDMLDDLDRLKRIHERNGYQRRRLAVTDTEGSVRSAWCYMMLPTWVEDIRSEPLAIYDETRHRL